MSERNVVYMFRILLPIAMYRTKFTPVKRREFYRIVERLLTIHTPINAGEDVLKNGLFFHIPEAPGGAHGRYDADGVGH